LASRNKNSTPAASQFDRGVTKEKSCDFVSRNLRLSGRRTSIRLERALWRTFDDIALREGLTVRALCVAVDKQRDPEVSLTAAVRLFTVSYYRQIVQNLEDVRAVPGHPRDFAEGKQASMASDGYSAVMQAALSELE
jgi:predicted DNA-binding ribbon-helix-helix protein